MNGWIHTLLQLSYLPFVHLQDLVILLSSRVKVVIAPLHIGCATITTTVRISAMSLAVVCSIPLFYAACIACTVPCPTTCIASMEVEI